MLSVEELRNRNGWNITKLGQATGLDRRLLAELERGAALATPEVAALLAAQGIEGLACSGDLIQKKELRGLRLRPYQVPSYNKEAWNRALKYYRALCLQVPRRSLQWLIRHVRADSALECILWLRLVLAGAKLRLANPHSCGYRGLPLVDEHGNALGERVLPCLHLKEEGLELLIWPQISLRPGKWTFRVDGLLLRVAPEARWGALEVDGAGHDHLKDDFRSAQLLQETIRLAKADVEDVGLVAKLSERIRSLWSCRPDARVRRPQAGAPNESSAFSTEIAPGSDL